MKRLIIIILGLLVTNCMAATHYVMMNNSGASDPYTSWTTAGTNIIQVVNAALTNTEPRVVWVTNGTYYLTNQVTISSALALQSVNGRDVTIVDGNNYTGKPVSNRCFELAAGGTVLDGFTVKNGVTTNRGGGICSTVSTTIKNCRVTGCVGSNFFIAWPAPGYEASIIHGAAVYMANGVMTNCEIIWNTNYNVYACINAVGSALVANCTIASNYSCQGTFVEGPMGAGIRAADNAVIDRCTIYGNTAIGSGAYGGSGVHLAGSAIIRNSLSYGNTSQSAGAGIYTHPGIGLPKIQNCTVVSNTTTGYGGGVGIYSRYDYGVNGNQTAVVENVISYFNAGTGNSSNFYIFSESGAVYIVNSCIAPTNAFPTSGRPFYYANNIEVNPQFTGKDTGDWRLTKTSPCVNAGTNETWMDGAVDLDLHSRIDRFSGIVDMGCYEYLLRGTMVSGR